MKTVVVDYVERDAIVCDNCEREIEYEFNNHKRMGKDFCSIACGEIYFKEMNKNQNGLFEELPK